MQSDWIAGLGADNRVPDKERSAVPLEPYEGAGRRVTGHRDETKPQAGEPARERVMVGRSEGRIRGRTFTGSIRVARMQPDLQPEMALDGRFVAAHVPVR